MARPDVATTDVRFIDASTGDEVTPQDVLLRDLVQFGSDAPKRILDASSDEHTAIRAVLESSCKRCEARPGDNPRCVYDGEWHAWAGPIQREAS